MKYIFFPFFFFVQVITDLIDAEDKISTNSEVGQIQEAISWYNKALGFRIDSGHGNGECYFQLKL